MKKIEFKIWKVKITLEILDSAPRTDYTLDLPGAHDMYLRLKAEFKKFWFIRIKVEKFIRFI